MLEQKLKPLLASLKGDHSNQWIQVRSWFSENEKNLTDSFVDLEYLTTLERKQRTLVTYPVLGNYFLHEVSQFTVEPDLTQFHNIIIDLIRTQRFAGYHKTSLEEDLMQYAALSDEGFAMALQYPEKSMELLSKVHRLFDPLNEIVRSMEKRVGRDLGHELTSPLRSFTRNILWRVTDVYKITDMPSLPYTVMVVDDEMPKYWYDRLLSVGFKHDPQQQGFFTNGEDALAALETGTYHCILSDIDLGDGKMDGIIFFEQAYAIQQQKGIPPAMTLFSSNQQLLEKARERVDSYPDRKYTMDQVNQNNKSTYHVTSFRFYAIKAHEST